LQVAGGLAQIFAVASSQSSLRGILCV